MGLDPRVIVALLIILLLLLIFGSGFLWTRENDMVKQKISNRLSDTYLKD